MKIKDIAGWPERWATPVGTYDADAPVADGVLVGLSLWGRSIIGLAIERPEGKYFGSIRAEGNVYNLILDFLKRNHAGHCVKSLMPN
jgi:hypothetical protein